MMQTLPAPLQTWSDAVASGDIEKVVDQYAKNALLKGTVFSGFVAKTDASADFQGQGRIVRDYFVFLTTGKKDLHVRWDKIATPAQNVFAVYYTFLWNDVETGEAMELRADATFVFDANGKIVLHHSSPA